MMSLGMMLFERKGNRGSSVFCFVCVFLPREIVSSFSTPEQKKNTYLFLPSFYPLRFSLGCCELISEMVDCVCCFACIENLIVDGLV
jgi:hypothetical protein